MSFYALRVAVSSNEDAIVTAALRIVHRNALVYRRTWRGSCFGSFLQPALFLVGIGVGVGSLMKHGGTPLPDGVDFLHFFGPGMLAAACMQTAAFESSWPILNKIVWRRTYDGVASTPMRIVDIVVGEMLWIA